MANSHRHTVYVIAEAGVNHNGSLQRAIDLVDAAADAGVDAVKFQTFKAEKLVTADAATADYQTAATGDLTQFAMLKRLELGYDAHRQLFDHATRRGVEFLSTGFDQESLAFLDQLGVSRLKVPSGEITNYPLLRAIAKIGKPTIVSTGMATMDEIDQCLQVLADHGLQPGQITVLHCNTQYPTPMKDVNLHAMPAIARRWPGVHVGYSDHTLGIEVPIAATALGATMIEKHFTLDRDLPGPDHAASLIPTELAAMTRAIRNVTDALGDGIKQPTASESNNRDVVRKSLVAAQAITRGELFSDQNLTTKRPGHGRSPMDWPDVIGTPASRDYQIDELIE